MDKRHQWIAWNYDRFVSSCNFVPKKRHVLHEKFVHRLSSTKLVQDRLAKPSSKLMISMVEVYITMVAWLTTTALLALRLSHSTAWMACEVELLEGSRCGTCWDALMLVVLLVLSSSDELGNSDSNLSSLSSRISEHSSGLWTSMIPWFMFPRYYDNRCAWNRV